MRTVNSGGATDANVAPELIGLSDGGFVIVYDDNEDSTIKLQRFDSGGTKVGTEVTVTGSDLEGFPTVSLTDDGRLLVGWTDTTITGPPLEAHSNVEFSIFDPRENIITGDGTSETITSRIDGATVNGGGGNDTLLGQGAADTLNGESGDDTIRGRGGDDLIQGGFSHDTIFGDSGNDTIFANTQADPNGSNVGDTIDGGSGNDTITGSNGGDTIAGGSSSDTINGGGGNDTLLGGLGTDTVNGDGGNDLIQVLEGEFSDNVNGGNGADTLDLSAITSRGSDVDLKAGTYDLSPSFGGPNTISNVENVLGTQLKDTIKGDGADNLLDGGAGKDTLTGGGGADQFQFTAALAAANVDTLKDFDAGVDRILLDDAVFTGLALGALPNGQFHIGPSAAGGNDRIIYDSASGDLFFDVDGTGGTAQVRFAKLDPGLALSAADFLVI